MFARDRSILAKVGVPIETIARATLDDAPGYRLNPHNYYLPEVSFTPDEAAVLALAGDKDSTTNSLRSPGPGGQNSQQQAPQPSQPKTAPR